MFTKLVLLYAPNILILMKGIGKNLSWRTYGAGEGIQTLSHSITSRVRYRCATPADKWFGEQFQSHASSMELHNLEYAQRTEVLVRRSWSSECSIDEAGIVFT